MLTLARPKRRLRFEDYVAHAAAGGLRMTERRRDVLRLIWNAARPIGAYEIAEQLGQNGASAHPAIVYRCLHRLAQAGLIIPILSWKRHVIAPVPGVGRWGVLLCSNCRACTPVDLGGEHQLLIRRVHVAGWTPRTWSAEAEGLCRACRQDKPCA